MPRSVLEATEALEATPADLANAYQGRPIKRWFRTANATHTAGYPAHSGAAPDARRDLSKRCITPIRARSPGSWLPVFCASSFTPSRGGLPQAAALSQAARGYTLTWKVIDVSEVNSSAVLTPEVPVDWPSR